MHIVMPKRRRGGGELVPALEMEVQLAGNEWETGRMSQESGELMLGETEGEQVGKQQHPSWNWKLGWHVCACSCGRSSGG
jgi:hypothetical protein